MPSSLAIEQLSVDCQMPHALAADTRRAGEVRDRVLASTLRELPEYLARALAAEPQDEAIAFIDALRFDVVIGAQWPRDQVARALTAQLARSLWRALQNPDTVRFKDRPELLARFAGDLARGVAYARPWHRVFDGLRPLPASAILRTLIVEDPPTGLAALTRLAPADLDRVVSLLSAADAQRTLDAVLGAETGGGACDPGAIAAAMLSQRCFALDAPQRRLALAVAIARQPLPVGPRDLALAGVLLDLAAAPDLSAIDPGAVADAVRALKPALPQAKGREQRATCGGTWLLLPHVLGTIGGDDAAPALALGILAAAAGPRAAQVWRETSLRDALGVGDDALPALAAQAARWSAAREAPPPESPRAAARTRRRDLAHLRAGLAPFGLSPRSARAVARRAEQAMAAYARRLPGFAESSFGHLWDNLLATAASVRLEGALIDVALDPPSLDVVWKISGADRATYALPDGRAVRVAVVR